MKTIKNSKEITTLEVGDKVVFGDFCYIVTKTSETNHYYLSAKNDNYDNDTIIKVLYIDVLSFNENLGITCKYGQSHMYSNAFPEYISLEALTAFVSALFKKYEKQSSLPKTWEEFYMNYPIQDGEYFINHQSSVQKVVCYNSYNNTARNHDSDRNICTSESESKAFRALMQLRQLRKAYVKNWEPDWRDETTTKHCIAVVNGAFDIHGWYNTSHVLSFPTSSLAEQFLYNFKNLLEIAKPLL